MCCAIILGCLVYLASLSFAIFGFVVVFWGLPSLRIDCRCAGRRVLSAARDDHDVIMKQFNAITGGAKRTKLQLWAAGRVSRRPGEIADLFTQADHQRHISLCSSIELGQRYFFSLDRHSRVRPAETYRVEPERKRPHWSHARPSLHEEFIRDHSSFYLFH